MISGQIAIFLFIQFILANLPWISKSIFFINLYQKKIQQFGAVHNG